MSVSFYELQSHLDPHYQSQMRLLRERINSQYDIARFNAMEARERENIRGEYDLRKQRERDAAAWSRDSMREDREDTRHRNQLQTRREIEELRFSNQSNLALIEHERKLKLLEQDLANKIKQSQYASMDNSLQFFLNEGKENLAAMRRSREAHSQNLRDIYKNFAGAIFQELAEQSRHDRAMEISRMDQRHQLDMQTQAHRNTISQTNLNAAHREMAASSDHSRNLERIDQESLNRRKEKYFSSVVDHIFNLVNNGHKRMAESEVSRLVQEWNADGGRA